MLTRNQRPTSHGLLQRVTPLLLMAVLLCSCTQPGEESPQPSGELKGMAEDKHVHHGIDYIEFAVTDMDQSKRFYQTAFDWKFNDYGSDYAGIQKPGGEAGGFRLESEVSAGSPLVVLYSRDLDMTLTRVREAGGRILKEPFDFPGGRRFEFEDPSGNQLAVWSDK